MDRLFLDANVMFSAAYREAVGVARLWEIPDAVLLTSDYAVEEARRNLSDARQRGRLDALLGSVEQTGSITLASEFRDGIELREKDWPIMGGAVASGATHLITGDLRDFGPYLGRRLLGVLIQTPAEYLRSRSR